MHDHRKVNGRRVLPVEVTGKATDRTIVSFPKGTNSTVQEGQEGEPEIWIRFEVEGKIKRQGMVEEHRVLQLPQEGPLRY